LALLHQSLTAKIIKVFYDVYNELGYGFLESVYEAAFAMALREAHLHVEQQVPIPVWFRGKQLGAFKADLLVENRVIVELKAARSLDPAHEAQLLHYLKATNVEVGMLVNFGERPTFRRLLFDNKRKTIRANPCQSVAK
jgi:GxxExxY protein